MLPAWFIFIAIGIRLAGGLGYVLSVLRGKAKPNPITWFIWGLTPLVAFAAQLQENVGPAALMTLALGISPLTVFVISLFKSRSASHFTIFNIGCGLLALFGVIMWQLTDNPLLAITFSIGADVFASVPTIQKGYRRPESEAALPFLFSIVSMVITLLTLTDWHFASYAFPLYMLVINVVIFGAILLGNKRKRRRLKLRATVR